MLRRVGNSCLPRAMRTYPPQRSSYDKHLNYHPTPHTPVRYNIMYHWTGWERLTTNYTTFINDKKKVVKPTCLYDPGMSSSALSGEYSVVLTAGVLVVHMCLRSPFSHSTESPGGDPVSMFSQSLLFFSDNGY